MQEDRISRFFDLNNIKAEADQVIEYLNATFDTVKRLQAAVLSLDKASGFGQLQKALEDANRAISAQTAATVKLGEATAAAAKKQIDAYTQLKNQYADALRYMQVMAAQYGAQSDQAIKAAQAMEVYKQRLEEIKKLQSTGGKTFDPNSVPFENKTGNGGEAPRAQDFRFTESSIDEMRAHVDTLTEAYGRLSAAEQEGAAGQALLADIQRINTAYDDAVLHSHGFSKTVEETGQTIRESSQIVEDVVLRYDKYTGTLQDNIRAQQDITRLIQANKAAQKDVTGASEADLAKLAQLRQEELELNAASKELNQTIQSQVKELQASEGSLGEMQAQLALLQQAYTSLGEAAQKGAIGKEMLAEITALDKEVTALESSMGRNQRKVGDYFGAIQAAGQKLMNFVTRDLFRALAAGVVFGLGAQALDLLANSLKDLYKDFELGTGAARTFNLQLQSMRDLSQQEAESYGKEKADLDVLVGAIEKENVSKKERLELLDELHQKFPGYFDDIKNEHDIVNKLADAYKRASQGILLKAEAQAAQDLIAKNDTKGLQAELDMNNQIMDLDRQKSELSKYYSGQRLADNQKLFERMKQDAQQTYLDVMGDIGKTNQFLLDKIISNNEQIDKLGGKTKKGPSDSTKDYAEELYKQQDATRKAQFETQQLMLKDKADYDKSILEDDQRTFDDRLKASQKFYDDSLEMLTKQRDYELKEVDSKTGDAARKVQLELQNGKLTASQRETLQKTLTAIDQAGTEERKKILEKFNNDVFNLNETSGSQISKIMDDDEKQRQQRVKQQIDGLLKVMQDQVQATDEAAQDELRKNDEAYAKGLISKKAYEKKKLEIESEARKESLGEELNYYEAILDLAGLDEKTREEYEKKIAKIRQDFNEGNTKDLDKTAQKEKDYLSERNRALKELGDTLKNTVFSVLDDSIERRKNALQDQIDGIDKLTQAEIDGINKSVDSEQNKANKIAIINAQAAAQKQALQDKQKQLDEQKAKYDKAKNVVDITENTAVGIIKAMADYPGPPGQILAAIIAATGAAELAAVLAQPIPHYAKGTMDHGGGLAVVGDAGRSELVVTPGGELYRTPNTSTLVDLPEHSMVLPQLPSAETLAMWATKGAVNLISGRSQGPDKVVSSITKMNRDLYRAIKEIPQTKIITDSPLKSVLHSGGSVIKYLKKW